MRILILCVVCMLAFGACTTIINEPLDYTGRELEYPLYKTSEFDFSGVATIKEYPNGGIEIYIRLNWDGPLNSNLNYPAHLHFGSVDLTDAPMAYMLNPVNGLTLQSQTRIEKLSDGTTLDFDSFKDFDGHIKVHLASEGTDYKTILVAGNVGKNYSPAR